MGQQSLSACAEAPSLPPSGIPGFGGSTGHCSGTEGAVRRGGGSPWTLPRLLLPPVSGAQIDGRLRPVLDLSALNHFLRCVHFRMHMLSSLREALHPGDCVTSFVLSDVYLYSSFRRTGSGSALSGVTTSSSSWRCLFGLSLSPWVIPMAVREFGALLRGRGIRLRSSLDDWAILTNCAAVCSQQTQQTLTLASPLGFTLTPSSSSLLPSQSFLFLGMAFDAVAWSVRPVARRIDQFLRVWRSCRLAHSRPER